MAEFKYTDFDEEDKTEIEAVFSAARTLMVIKQLRYYDSGKHWHKFSAKEKNNAKEDQGITDKSTSKHSIPLVS